MPEKYAMKIRNVQRTQIDKRTERLRRDGYTAHCSLLTHLFIDRVQQFVRKIIQLPFQK